MYVQYHTTYSSAVSEALDMAKERGYDVNEDDVSTNITFGPGRPKVGQTVRHHITLSKDGDIQKEKLHFQVYNKGNSFELNAYIS